MADLSFHYGAVWRMEFEISVPVRGPRRQQQDLPTLSLEQHLLQPVLSVASIVLIGFVVIAGRPEGREFQVRIFSGEREADIFFSNSRVAEHSRLDGVL